MRALGVDLGSRRVGLARSDQAQTLAVPWRTLERSGDADHDQRALVDAALEAEVGTVVVGLPLSLDGRIGPAARRVLEEVEGLREALGARGVAVETVDERLSTVTADARLAAGGRTSRQRRPHVDQAAAAVILQSWLDAGGTTDPGRARPARDPRRSAAER